MKATIRSRRCGGLLVALLTALGLTVASTGSAGAAEFSSPLWKQCAAGEGAGQCVIPRGIGTDPINGNVYVADQSNYRILEFTAWGEFVKGWGWGVVNGEAKLQSCGPGAAPATKTCQAGLEGSGAGQFGNFGPQGIAIDSNGDVYVIDWTNHRVQKFDSEGHFLLMLGGEVDKGGGTPSNPGNLCTAEYIANGDACGIGTEGTANGQFERWPFPVNAGSYVAAGIDDTVYVGDKNRIQKFNSNGEYIGQIGLPESGEVGSIAFDLKSGDLYFAYKSPSFTHEIFQRDVFKLNPATGVVLATLKVDKPYALAVSAQGNLYASQREYNVGEGGLENHPSRIIEFDSAGNQVGTVVENEALRVFDQFEEASGIATSSACGIPGSDIYLANSSQYTGFISAYGPPPNPAVCPPPELPPSIEDSYAISADTDGATVRAAINPHFWPDVRYYVQYGTGKCSKGECTQESAQPGSLLTSKVADKAINTANVLLPDLVPNTTYHYRFIANSGGGGPTIGPERIVHTFMVPAPSASPDACLNTAFRTGASAKLSDCRAYEMVSPLNKNNGDVATEGGNQTMFVQAAANGERMTFSSFRAFAGAESAALTTQYLASRDPVSGWTTRSISPPREDISYYPLGAGEGIQYKAFSEDLCAGWLLQDTGIGLTEGAPTGVPNIYRRKNCGESGYDLVTTTAPPGYSPAEGYSRYYAGIQGFSADGTHSLLHAPAALTPNANPKKGIFQVYETYGEGRLRLVSVLPNGTAAATHSSVGTPQLGVEDGFRVGSVYHAVSEDGSRVFWSASSSQQTDGQYPAEAGKLYLRLNATEAQSKVSAGKCTEADKACTIAVSEDVNTTFETADIEGTRAIYAVGNIGAGNAALYEFDTATETSQMIAKGVEGVVGASDNADRVYFVSNDLLSGEDENSEGDKAQAGKRNLYLYEAGVGFSFVAKLPVAEFLNNDINSSKRTVDHRLPRLRASRVGADGLSVAFISKGSLTGYDNVAVSNDEAATEVYHYQTTGGGDVGELLCVSCNPSGARPQVRRNLAGPGGFDSVAASIPGWNSQTQPSRALSADGDRLFFNSYDALVPRDTNGRADVYEWEAPTSGDCTEESSAFSVTNGGCITLISSGESPEDSEFFDATRSGSDVFFATQSSLLVQDYGLVDVYDARVNGGFPAPPNPTPSCEGEACQGALAPPNDPTPASAAYEGPGNSNTAAKKKKAKKHKKRRQGKKAKHKRASANRRVGR
jgi:NHL repeat